MRPEPLLPGPGPTWFIYYRVDAARADDVVAAARQLIERAREACPGLRSQLMQRPLADTGGGMLTMMEVYHLPASLDAQAGTALGRALAQWAPQLLGEDMAGQRHLEVFVPCA